MVANLSLAFPQLQLIYWQVHGFRASQTTSEQQSDHCCISSAVQGVLRTAGVLAIDSP